MMTISKASARDRMPCRAAYRATLTVGDEELSQDFEIVKEAGVTASQADLQAQFDLLLSIRDKVSATHKVDQSDARCAGAAQGLARAAGWAGHGGRHPIDAAKALEEQVLEVEKELMIPETRQGWPDAMNHGDRLATQLSNLSFNVNLGDYKPTDYEFEAFDEIAGDIDGVADKVRRSSRWQSGRVQYDAEQCRIWSGCAEGGMNLSGSEM